MEIKNKVKLSQKISNPDEFNYNLNLLRSDVNALLANSSLLESAIYKHAAIYNEDYIDQLTYRVRLLQGQINAIRQLSENNQFSNVVRLNFHSQSIGAPYNVRLYKDPKTKATYSKAGMLKIDNIAGCLGLPEISEQNVTIKKTSFNHPVQAADYSNIKNGIYDYYILQHSADPVTLELLLEFDSAKLNTIQFELGSEFPMDLTKVEYYKITWQELEGLGAYSLSGKVTIPLGSTITTSKIRLTFSLNQCRVTNRITVDNSDQALLKYLVNSRTEYLEMDLFDNQLTTDYENYIFHIGIRGIKVLNRQLQGSGIFVSNPLKSVEPAHFHLKSSSVKSNIALEYFLALTEYDKNNIIIGNTEFIPLLPVDQTAVEDEKLVFSEGKATLCFYPHTDLVISLDGTELVKDVDYTLTGNTIEISNPAGDYTASYTPVHISRTNLTPVSDPMSAVAFEEKYETNYGVEVSITVTDGVVTEVADGGMPYIRFITFADADPDTIEIKRYIDTNMDEDNRAPLIVTSGESKNVYVSGRKVYIPFDTELYPRLVNCIFTVSGTYKYDAMESDKFYYAKDNSLVINWDSFDTTDYSYTLARLIIVARQLDESEDALDPNLQIKDILLFSNTFNDFLIKPTSDIRNESNYSL